MFQGHTKKAFRVLKGSFNGVSKKIERCFNGVFNGFQRCFKISSIGFQWKFKRWIFQGSFKGVSVQENITKSFQGISKNFDTCFVLQIMLFHAFRRSYPSRRRACSPTTPLPPPSTHGHTRNRTTSGLYTKSLKGDFN